MESEAGKKESAFEGSHCERPGLSPAGDPSTL